MNADKLFAKFASGAARATGSPVAFILCVVMVVLWAASGPIFKFSETWQLVINTSTTIITFLMVFLIQNTQNRDGAAVQAKLDELILSSLAENEFIGIEKLTDKELASLKARCEKAAKSHGALADQLTKAMGERKGSSDPKPEPKPRTSAAKPKRAASANTSRRRKSPSDA